ncbi:MAG TPA: type II toxin-antitoxin system death-on-curing family toxin [Gemmatimonadaceae bacterium]|nr:type II toxin-antitoxin system death-on-curing family toxin [Gemmatimonadaceae bacterium]
MSERRAHLAARGARGARQERRAFGAESTQAPVVGRSKCPLSDLAAAYLVGFARSQGFNDGNKRIGLACALVFLALNGSPLHAAPEELYALTMAAATGQADDHVVAAFLRDRLTGDGG